jgi:hypothetical protein
VGAGGRVLTEHEQEAWDAYEAILDKYHERYKVSHYDRVSIHKAFPEIEAAFDYCCELSKETVRHQKIVDVLKDDYKFN